MPSRKPVAEKTYADFIQPFLIDHSAIRGRLVRLDKALNTILKRHQYPAAVSALLAEQMVLASLLSATLAEGGILTVQTKTDGPVRFMVVDVMAGGAIRGYADMDKEALAAVTAEGEAPLLSQVLGKGYLAVTLDQGGESQRYQSIVSMEGETLREAFEGYFVQSQQAEIALHVSVRAPSARHKQWSAGGIIIERIAQAGGKKSKAAKQEQDTLWERTCLFMRTIRDEEMLDSHITPQNLLYRLFNEDGVWVYRLQPLKVGCRCSRDRVKTALKSLPQKELLSMLDNDRLSIHCQFCNKREIFTKPDIEKLYRKPVNRRKSK
jgi:molecular chaperone Hsp33